MNLDPLYMRSKNEWTPVICIRQPEKDWHEIEECIGFYKEFQRYKCRYVPRHYQAKNTTPSKYPFEVECICSEKSCNECNRTGRATSFTKSEFEYCFKIIYGPSID